jgi:hypothetical protein
LTWTDKVLTGVTEKHVLDRMIYNSRYLERSNNMDNMDNTSHDTLPKAQCSRLRAVVAAERSSRVPSPLRSALRASTLVGDDLVLPLDDDLLLDKGAWRHEWDLLLHDERAGWHVWDGVVLLEHCAGRHGGGVALTLLLASTASTLLYWASLTKRSLICLLSYLIAHSQVHYHPELGCLPWSPRPYHIPYLHAVFFVSPDAWYRALAIRAWTRVRRLRL